MPQDTSIEVGDVSTNHLCTHVLMCHSVVLGCIGVYMSKFMFYPKVNSNKRKKLVCFIDSLCIEEYSSSICFWSF